MTKNIVNAKEAEEVKAATKVYGFIGIPDTHSLETYLKWKKIQYERVDVNPLKIEEIFSETDCGKNLTPLLPPIKTPFNLDFNPHFNSHFSPVQTPFLAPIF